MRKRQAQMAVKVVDLTHDTLPEIEWRPLNKPQEVVPPNWIVRDQVLLREWECEQINEQLKHSYDRRALDVDVLRRFQAQGDVIKNAIDGSELSNDEAFMKRENQITNVAQQYIKQLKQLKLFDLHKLQPEPYKPTKVSAQQRIQNVMYESEKEEPPASEQYEDDEEESESDEDTIEYTEDRTELTSQDNESNFEPKKMPQKMRSIESTDLEVSKNMLAFSRG